MPVPAVALGFDQGRAVSLAGMLGSLEHGAAHGQHVHAIHHHARDAISGGAQCDIVQLAGFDPRHRHGILVVLHHEHHRQVPQGGHVERFVEVAGVGCAFAEEAQHHAIAAHQLLGQRRADGNRYVAAHDAGRAQVAVRHVGDVHGAALAFAVAAGFAEHFGHHLVVVFLLCGRGAGSLVAMRVGVTVAAVGAGHQVVVTQCCHRADSHGFLPGI